MQCDHNNGATVIANGVDITSQFSSGSLTNTTVTGITSPLTSLKIFSHNGDAGYLGSVTIDGTMLVDPLAPNGDAATTNFNPFNTDIKSVRGKETGYATFNPLDFGNTAGSTTFSDGNLKAAFPSDSGTGQAPATIYVSSGKWYCEFYLESTNDLTSCQYGLYLLAVNAMLTSGTLIQRINMDGDLKLIEHIIMALTPHPLAKHLRVSGVLLLWHLILIMELGRCLLMELQQELSTQISVEPTHLPLVIV